VGHRAKIGGSACRTAGTVAIPESHRQRAARPLRTIGVNDPQLDLTVCDRPRSNRRAGALARGHIRTLPTLTSDYANDLEIGETRQRRGALATRLLDSFKTGSADRCDHHRTRSRKHGNTRIRRGISDVQNNPDAVGSLNRDEVDDPSGRQQQADEIAECAAGNQAQGRRSAFIDAREISRNGDNQRERRECEGEAELEGVIAGGETKRALVVVHDAKPHGTRHGRLERADPQQRNLFRDEVTDRDERRDSSERYQRRAARWFVHRSPGNDGVVWTRESTSHASPSHT